MARKTLIRFTLGLFFSLACIPSQGQYLVSTMAAWSPERSTESHLHDFLKADLELNSEFNLQVQSEFSSFVSKLQRKQHRYKFSREFLRYAYYKIHHKFLRHYQTPVNFSELFQKGNYDCLTGTALYAMIFKELGFHYEITETTYHIYLTVYVDGSPILIESTNPLGGFMDDPKTMGLMIKAYREGSTESSSDYYRFEQPVYHNITLGQLSGLHHYNLALEAYNQKHLNIALKHMEQAMLRYPSDRLHEVMQVMIKTLTQDHQIDQSLKRYYLSRYAQPQLDASQDQY